MSGKQKRAQKGRIPFHAFVIVETTPFLSAKAKFEKAFGKEKAELLRDTVLFITSDAFLHALEE